MIPVFEPYIGEEEVEAVAAAVRRGEISGSFGEEIPAFEREFAGYVGARHGVACTSGTTALHLAVAALELEPGSEVLVSASTNIATALAAFHNGCVPVPVDSEGETWNLDLDLVEDLITERTRAIIPVHLFGHPVDMDRLNEIAGPPRPRGHRGLRRVARRDRARAHDRRARRHGLLQLLRQQDHHHRRGRDGHDERRRSWPSGCATCATSRSGSRASCT